MPPAPQLAARQIYIVDMPGAEQSQIRIGWVGVARATPDYFTLQVLNTVLGGSFTSRLNQNLREKHGYSYGASSRFDMRLSRRAVLRAGAGVQTDKTAEALREFFNELNGHRASRSRPTSWRRRRTTSRSASRASSRPSATWPSHLEELIIYKLPDDYFERYVANVQAVTADDGAEGGGDLHPARPIRRRHRRRPQGDRAGHP